jgi:membrane protein
VSFWKARDLRVGPGARSIQRRPGWRWLTIGKATVAEASKHNLDLIASGVAFYGFFALVPTLTAVILSYALFAEPDQVEHHLSALANLVSNEAAKIIAAQVRDLVGAGKPGAGMGLFLSLGLAFYGIMRGAGAIITALNIVYEVDETRSFTSHAAVTVGVAASMVGIFILAAIAITTFALLQSVFPDLARPVRLGVQIGLWFATAFAVRIAISSMYRFAPNRRSSPAIPLRNGSAFATIGWIAATTGFSVYVRNLGSYNAIYGILGAVVIFLTWLYASAYIILLGAELNGTLERGARMKGLGAEPA